MPNTIEKASFEKAYAFYRSKEDKAALGVISKLDQNETRVIELKTQILYRMERFDDALELLKKLLRTHSDEFDDIRRANLTAIKVRLQSQGIDQELDLMNLNTFELMFNASSHLIACEKYNEAYKLLEKSLVECERILTEDGLSKDELQLEMAPILAQKAFVLQKLGSLKEALLIYKRILGIRNLDWKLRKSVLDNLEADYNQYGKKWRPIKRKPHDSMEHDGVEVATETPKKKPRRKKPRAAKHESDALPDPERWLPRQERTAYKKKLHKKFKDREVGRGTQGAAAVGTSSANIDYSGKAPGNTPAMPSPHASPKPTEGPRQQRPGQQAKKNKKKGGKW